MSVGYNAPTTAFEYPESEIRVLSLEFRVNRVRVLRPALLFCSHDRSHEYSTVNKRLHCKRVSEICSQSETSRPIDFKANDGDSRVICLYSLIAVFESIRVR